MHDSSISSLKARLWRRDLSFPLKFVSLLLPDSCCIVNMKTALCCFLLAFLLPNLTLIVSALSFDGTALLSLLRHWKKVPSSIKFNWNASDSAPCSWLGVHCNHYNLVVGFNLSGFAISGQLGPEIAYLKHLESVDLSNNRFSGPIPTELGNCTRLEALELSQNSFIGRIPDSLGDLPRLKYLSLWDNSLGGGIPESLFRVPFLSTIYLNDNRLNGSIPAMVGNMSQHLESLYLYNNHLSGVIPSAIGNCSALQELYLNNNFLEGMLPNSLNNLEQLVYLFVNDNNLVGRIPFGLGNCKKLVFLVLSNNQFGGGLPSGLGNCSSLTNLAAVNCGLSGDIPSSLGQLANLEILYLSMNQLRGGIPPELGNCRALVDLQMYENQLEGEIPSELGSLTQLQTLMLFTNHLKGEIPISIWTIQSLRHLIVYQNNLVGEIPNEITQLKQLRNLSLFENQFTGVIPPGLGENSSLELVDLTRNKFSGPISPKLCFKKQLIKLLLGYNQFQGSIPSDVGRCFSLTRMILKQNNLTGVLPEFAENSNLLYMDISNNSITGPIPSTIGKLSNITFVDLSLNNLTGHIPPEVGSLANLEALNLSSNSLDGMLPSNLSGCYSLSKLDVSHNLLSGTIPSSSLRSLMKLSILDLSENDFDGGIPESLFQLRRLSALQLGANQLQGSIPPSIGLEVAAESLRLLNLSNNRLTGHAPREIGNLKMLEQLDICCNYISGNLEAIGELPALTKINVSFNAFTGPVPTSLMKFLSLSPSSFIGNRELCINCHPDDGTKCQGNNSFKFCDQLSRKRGLKPVHIALIAFGSFLVTVTLLLGIYYVFVRRKSHEHNLLVCVEEGTSSLLNQVMEATENLNDQYVIGRGAHGVVYKVTLAPHEVYALKKFDFVECTGGRTGLFREMQTIGKVRHRNLIKLEDYWLRKEHGLILYSYMTNGSLHDVLYNTNPRLPLEWDVRYKIALGTAEGLSYLHFDCSPAIIHRDIKPMNILLDSDLEPHISDFGIAKLLDESVAAIQSSTVHGTIGYLAPEKAFSTKSSKETDVYAYGVVVLELLTRKKVFHPSFGGVADIVGWVRSVWSESEDIEAIVDSNLRDEFIDSSIKEQAKDVLLLALRCTEKEPGRRPSMRDVVKQLTDNSGRRMRSRSKCTQTG